MENALWITLVGMGMVFFVILLLWGGMALLVRLAAGRTAQPEGAASPAGGEAAEEDVSGPAGQKRRAAAAAVAAALALNTQAGMPGAGISAPPPAALSPWQAVNRARRLAQSSAGSRKRMP